MSTAERPTPRADVEGREMTTEVELLPMPKPEAIGMYQAWSYDQMQAYARANVLHHTAALQGEIERLHEQLRRETERRWEGNRRAAQEYVDDMRDVLNEAVRICKDLDDEALAKEGRLACGAECAAAIEDLAARMNVRREVNHE